MFAGLHLYFTASFYFAFVLISERKRCACLSYVRTIRQWSKHIVRINVILIWAERRSRKGRQRRRIKFRARAPGGIPTSVCVYKQRVFNFPVTRLLGASINEDPIVVSRPGVKKANVRLRWWHSYCIGARLISTPSLQHYVVLNERAAENLLRYI